jgi:spore maturation protein CgeB
MKILVAGDWHSNLHEDEVCNSLRRLGHEVFEFKWFHYFTFDPTRPHSVTSLSMRGQNKFVAGPLIKLINKDFLEQVRNIQLDLIFVYRGTHITASTLKTIRQEFPFCKLIGYNNDDPFSPSQSRYLWRHFMECIPFYDLILAYRHANLDDFKKAGARKVELMRSWYVPDRNYPVVLSDFERQIYDCDVVFIGHFEPDQRLEYLESILSNGYRLRLFGPTKYWMKPLRQSPFLKYLAPTRMVWGDDYNKALCGAKIALCFLSKLNRDTYTRRCFEIPATNTFLLSEYSDDLAKIYEEGVDVDFFRSKEEMIEKISYYIAQTDERMKIAKSGYNKVRLDRHDIDSRISDMLTAAERS